MITTIIDAVAYLSLFILSHSQHKGSSSTLSLKFPAEKALKS